MGFAVAALPVGAPLDPDRVEYAVCGDVFTGAVYSAARGQGAALDGRAITASHVIDPRHAILGANIGHEHVADTAGTTMEDAVGRQRIPRAGAAASPNGWKGSGA